MQIRSAEPEDVPALARMNAELVEDQGSSSRVPIDELEERFRVWIRTGEYYIDMFDESGSTFGYAVYQVRGDYYFPAQRVVYLRHFFIERRYRGQGWGTVAFETLTAQRFPKEHAVALDVVSTNPIGQLFWEKLGFKPYFTEMKRSWPPLRS